MRTIPAWLAVAVALTGCGAPVERESDERPPETTALEFIADGRYLDAADEYVSLARAARGAAAQDRDR